VISSDNRLAYVPDLGLDQIRIYRLDPGHAGLAPADPPFVKEQAGSGPRHMAFSPNGKFAYVINELKPVVTVFSHDSARGTFKEIQTVSSVPPGFTGESAPAEVAVDRKGRFLYASNRGPGTIAVFSIDAGNGTLRQIQMAETGGTWPRGFEIDPTGHWLVAGDQKSNQFVFFRVDPESGHLTSTSQVFQVPSPVSFLFVPVK
jgi:6-phosphogluconolactonase